MDSATVRFNESNIDRIPETDREAYHDIIRQVMAVSRPAGEAWTVTIHETQKGTLLTFDFSRGIEAARSLTFQPEGDDAPHSVLQDGVSVLASVLGGSITCGRRPQAT